MSTTIVRNVARPSSSLGTKLHPGGQVTAVLADRSNKNHHEFFRYIGNDKWEWWEHTDQEGEVELIKTFREETFLTEVMEPCADHTDDTH